MDPVLYVTAALILLVLILFTVKVRSNTQQADVEQRREVAQAAAPRPRVPEERGAGMPRRRRGMASVMANRRAQAAEEREPDPSKNHVLYHHRHAPVWIIDCKGKVF
uniref:DDRGK domain-containing protein 1 n=1 Tax=Knipowitschia caucasica TaxID=637954 RepID=A0AAV2LDS1_KNICA